MLYAHDLRRPALLAAVGCAFAATLHAGVARADSYGELHRIGSVTPGSGNGQFDSERTRLLGVDPTDNSVYVLDEPERFSQEKQVEIDPETKECVKNEVTGQCKQEGVGPITRHFRIQKLKVSGEKYVFAASVTFNETAPEAQFQSSAFLQAGVEGIAIDPTLHRLYVLTADDREKGLPIDEKYLPPGVAASEQGILVASTLYAFSTKDEGGKLLPDPATKEGILTGPGAGGFDAQSATPGKALLQPAGITVDPATHEVIVLGHTDEIGEATDSLAHAGDHFALQRVESSGKLGVRYTDGKDFFKQRLPTTQPDSPAVVPISGGVERVYVNFHGLAEVPYEFASKAEPHLVAGALEAPIGNGIVAGPKLSLQRESEGVMGGVLSVSTAGTVYAMGEIKTEEKGIGTDRRSGVLAFSGADGSELGFSGGQTPLLETGDKCATAPALETQPELPLRMAAGSEEKVFVLNPEFLKRWEGEEAATVEDEEERAIEGEKTKGPFFAAVIELGPNGSGCPHASVESIEAAANGKPLKESESIPEGSNVKFSSFITQGDALKVEWEFSNGTEHEMQVASGDELQKPTITHKFEHEGSWTVKETVHTDNLATPTITAEGAEKVKVSGSAPPEKPIIEGRSSALVGEVVTFSDPQTAGIAKYKWSFGDGAKEETAGPQVKHVYTKTCTCNVELVVVNSHGQESVPGSHAIKITEPENTGQAEREARERAEREARERAEREAREKAEHEAQEKAERERREHEAASGVLSYSASVSSRTLKVSKTGGFGIKVSCTGGKSCVGKVTVRTLSAVSAGKRKAILTLASASFSLAGGQVKVVALRLTPKARALLARTHTLRARATIAVTGASAPTQITLTLKAPPRHH